MSAKSKAYIQKRMTECIEKILEMDMGKWKRVWKMVVPMNGFSKRPYNGWNALIANFLFDMPIFFSVKQCKELGYDFKGLKTFPVFWWNVGSYKKKNDKGEEEMKKYFTLKVYNNFNISDLAKQNDIDMSKYVGNNDNKTLGSFEQMIEDLQVNTFVTQQAMYRHSNDAVGMPEIKAFDSSDDYYRTFAHEMIHWTMTKQRCDRKDDKMVRFGDDEYAVEELVAELGGMELAMNFGIEPSDNSLIYVKGWFKRFKDQPDVLMNAANAASKAVKWMMDEWIAMQDCQAEIADDRGDKYLPEVDARDIGVGDSVAVAS